MDYIKYSISHKNEYELIWLLPKIVSTPPMQESGRIIPVCMLNRYIYIL